MIPSAYGETMSECDAESVILDDFWALSDGSWVICWFMLGYFGSICMTLIAYGETMRDYDAECVILGDFWASGSSSRDAWGAQMGFGESRGVLEGTR